MKLTTRAQTRIILSAVFLSLTFFSHTNVIAQATQEVQTPANNEYQEGAIVWTQSSGEVRALAYQAFNLARMVLDHDLSIRHRNRLRPAIIVDVDETILDNSRYQATLLKNRQNHSAQRFTDWVNRVEATALPGAVEFLRYARSRGVRVFYITNRIEIEKEGTAANLKKLGFPEVNDQTLLVRTDPKTSSKELRRQSVDRKHRIVLLMGDNLNDFAEIFEQSKTVASRVAAAEQNKNKFGARFIVLPNAMYGDWENAIYDYNFKLTDEQKSAKRKSYLKTY